MKKFKITYKDRSLNVTNGKQRTENLICPLYWKEKVDGWQSFDGEITIENGDIKGCRDGAIVTLDVEEATESLIVREFMHNHDIFSVERGTQDGWERVR